MRDMKTGNQVERMNSGLKENFPNGIAQVGGGDEPDLSGSQLRVVRLGANDRVDSMDGNVRFSFCRKLSNRKETIMKNLTAVRIFTGLFLFFGLASLLAVPCHAQAEVAPDFYDVVSPAAVAQSIQPVANIQQQADPQFHGSFTLAHVVECSGKTLPAGKYSVALQSGETERFVTLRHNGKSIKLEARVLSPYSAPGQSALLVSRGERSRTLEAIYVQKLNVILYFRPDGMNYVAVNPMRAERVPIS
jgi:hypothetical protein